MRSQLKKNKEILMDEIERLNCEKMNETTAARLSVYRDVYKALCKNMEKPEWTTRPTHVPELDGDREFERMIMSISTDRAHYIRIQSYAIDMFSEVLEPSENFVIPAPTNIKGYLEA